MHRILLDADALVAQKRRRPVERCALGGDEGTGREIVAPRQAELQQALAQLQQQYASEKDAAKKADLAKKIESAKKPVVKTDEDVKNESKVLTDIGTAEVAKTNALKALQNERTQSLMDAQKEGLAMRFDLAQAALDAQEKKWESKAAALEEKRKKLKADYAKQRNAEISGDTEVEIKAAEEAAATDVGKQNIEIDLAINTEKAKLSLEKIQEEASPGLNATIRDRYYGAASSTPVAVFTTLLRLKNAHLKKLTVPRNTYFEKLLGEILAPVADFPKHLTLPDQGRFALGYYQQRQDFFSKKPDDLTPTTEGAST